MNTQSDGPCYPPKRTQQVAGPPTHLSKTRSDELLLTQRTHTVMKPPTLPTSTQSDGPSYPPNELKPLRALLPTYRTHGVIYLPIHSTNTPSGGLSHLPNKLNVAIA